MNIEHDSLLGVEALLPLEITKMLDDHKMTVADSCKKSNMLSFETINLDEHELVMQ